MEPVEGALIGLAILKEFGLAYFRAMELAGLKTQEEKDAHYNATRLEYYKSISEPVDPPPED